MRQHQDYPRYLRVAFSISHSRCPHALDKVAEMEAEAVIPPKANRKEQREYDKEFYKERHLIENFFNKIKQYRRVFSRFEKLSRNYLAFCQFASVLIWLR